MTTKPSNEAKIANVRAVVLGICALLVDDGALMRPQFCESRAAVTKLLSNCSK